MTKKPECEASYRQQTLKKKKISYRKPLKLISVSMYQPYMKPGLDNTIIKNNPHNGVNGFLFLQGNGRVVRKK